MKTKTIPINPDYQWEVEYNRYIYAQLKKKRKHWLWGTYWVNVGNTIGFNPIKVENKDRPLSGSTLLGRFFGRIQHVYVKEVDLDTFDLSAALDEEWAAHVNRKQLAQIKNKLIENIIDRA